VPTHLKIPPFYLQPLPLPQFLRLTQQLLQLTDHQLFHPHFHPQRLVQLPSPQDSQPRNPLHNLPGSRQANHLVNHHHNLLVSHQGNQLHNQRDNRHPNLRVNLHASQLHSRFLNQHRDQALNQVVVQQLNQQADQQVLQQLDLALPVLLANIWIQFDAQMTLLLVV
jgi:hypothetical protein